MLHWKPVVLGLALAWCRCCTLTCDELTAQDVSKAGRCYVLEVKGMTCEGCAGRVQKALVQIRGVAEAKVNYEKGEAHVCIKHGHTVSGETLVKAVAKAGYKANVKWQSED